MEKSKEIQALKKLAIKAKKQGNLKLYAEYANALGNLYSEIGDYQAAIDEHETELSTCQTLKDPAGEAVANRKLGECYIEIVDLEKAYEYISKYLNISKTLPDKTELQRAHVTLGRLHLAECGTIQVRNKKRLESEKKAEAAFMKALELCEQLKSKLPSAEYQDMKARSLLNLGLLANLRDEEKESLANIRNAVAIARKHSLQETLMLCLFHLADMLTKWKQFKDAADALCEILLAVNKLDSRLKTDAIKLHAQVSAEIGCVGEGLDKAKRILKQLPESEKGDVLPTAIKLHKIAMGIDKLQSANDEGKCKIYEKLGDYCCSLGANHRAISFYEKALHILNQLKADHSLIAPILSSLAQTYQDVKEFAKAINYYCSEVKIQKQLSKFDQAARSLLNIASCMEFKDGSFEVLRKCYDQAEAEAIKTDDPKLQLLVLQNYADTMKLYGVTQEYDECLAKIQSLKSQFGLDSQDDDQMADDAAESSDGGFELSDESDEDDEAEVVHSAARKPFKVLRNELGETKLHQAVIKGKKDIVIDLLKKGHPVNIRDHAGWLPIHEAANHNQVDIAKVLIEYGADVNDRGGEQCMGITPLHDACSSGHAEIIQLLLESGANVIAKENENSYPLDCLMDYRERGDDSLTEDQRTNLDEVEAMIRTRMAMKGINPKSIPFKERRAQKDIAEELPSIKPPTRPRSHSPEPDVDKEDCYPISLSPEQSATEMYKSAVANVRKSAKRIGVPKPSAGTSKDKEETTKALIADDSDVNIAAKNDWLIDDAINSPIKKKQRTVRDRVPDTRLIKSQTAELRAATSPPLSADFAESIEPERSTQPSPISITSSTQESPRKQSGVIGFNFREEFSQLLKQSAFEPPSFFESEGDRLQVNKNNTTDVQESDKPLVHSEKNGLWMDIDLNKSLQSVFSQELDGSSVANSEKQIIINQEGVKKSLNDEKLKNKLNSSLESAKMSSESLIESQEEDNRPVSIPSKEICSPEQTSQTGVYEPSLKEVKDKRASSKPKQKTPPTSTPLRKNSRTVPQFPLPSPALQKNSMVFNETRDSGITSQNNSKRKSNPESSRHQPFRDATNVSVLNNSATLPYADPNYSFNQSIRILVQWNNRTLLIPITRKDTSSIAWLCDEFVRRFSKSRYASRSGMNVPQVEDIILTRASDGAELFSEDLVTDVLIDNEKVLAVSIEDL